MSEYVFRIDEPIECCAKCPFIFERLNFDGKDWHYSCFISRKEVPYDGEKAEDCPLKELLPHGELVSRNNILNYFDDAYCLATKLDYEDAVAIVSNKKAIPTILEASKED